VRCFGSIDMPDERDSLSLTAATLTPAAFRGAAVAQLASLYRLARHLARDGAEADDLVQEAFLNAFRGAHTYQHSEGGMRPWLFKILHNCLRQRRRRDGRVTFDSDGVSDSADEGVTDPYAGLMTVNAQLDELDWDHVDERLKSAVASLPENLRVVFLLFAIEDLKYREIAEVLEIPTGTVMSRLARARRLLIMGLNGPAKDVEIQTREPNIVQEGPPKTWGR
jgi:RNA polymerase sigma-70 factor, ECF subfamily